ncbi:MAG: TerB family tellurite resistance protein [Nitrospirae bacterium]|nr:TerB family tellurite resistance protein [Nitrospirota bacterium]
MELSPDDPDRLSGHSIQIATAALFIEMMQSDAEVKEAEWTAIRKALKLHFSLSKEEMNALISLAEGKIWRASGYFEFTSLMNKELTYEKKVEVIEYLWEIAFADSNVDRYEEHMVRKIAHLIHVSHEDFIGAKLRAKNKLLS